MFERERRTAGAAASPTPVVRRLLLPLAFLALLAALFASQNGPVPLAHATDDPIVVKPSTMAATGPTSWCFWDEFHDPNTCGTGTGTFVAGPGDAPAGNGSAQMTVPDGKQGEALVTPQFNGVKLSDITALTYSINGQSTSQSNGVYLQFDVDFHDGATTYQGRLGFVPAATPNGTWQTIDATSETAGTWWNTHNTGDCKQSDPCTWDELTQAYANATIGNPSGGVGNLVFRIGNGTPTSVGYTADVDNFHIAAGGTTPIDEIFDFEPETACTTVCYVNATTGDDSFGGDSPTSAKKTIQAALDAVDAGGTVNVAAGTYNEDVNVSTPGVKLIGAGAGTGIDDPAATTIIGTKTDSPADTIYVGAVNVTVQGVNVTRAGNNAVDWDNHLKTQGITLRADGATLQDSRVTGNRNGVYVFYADGVTIKNNDIIDNRTGIQINDGTGVTVSDNLTIENNTITANWTLGILFNHVQSNTGGSTGIVVRNNNIAGNWYGGIEDRWAGSQPIDATNNWYGSDTPSVLAGNSGEPGYAVLIPTEFGGTSTPPSPLGQDIIWNNNTSNQLTFIPLLCNGADTDDGALGFTPESTSCVPGNTQPPSGDDVTVAASGVLDSTNNSVTDGSGFTAAYTGGGTVYTQLATYSGNPETDTGSFFGTGSAFFDVYASILSPDQGATLAVTFPGLTDGQVLRWWDGTAWQTVRNNDGTAPVVSGGTTTVTFGSSSSPRLDQLDGTPLSSGDPNAIELQLNGTVNSVLNGDQTKVDVVASATALSAADLIINYDPDILEIGGCNVTLGLQNVPIDYTTNHASGYTGCVGYEFDDTNGVLRISTGKSGTPASGDDILIATVTFTGKAANNLTATTVTVGAPASPAHALSDNSGFALPVALPQSLQIGGAGVVITGIVQLQGHTLTDAYGKWSGTTVTLVGTGASATTADDGSFTIILSAVPSGPVTIVATHAGYLRAGNDNYTVVAGSTTLPTVTLLGGDFNGDGAVETLDLGLLGGSWGATTGWPTTPLSAGTGIMAVQQDQTVDFNNDGIVDVLELGVLAGNYNKTSSVWPAN